MNKKELIQQAYELQRYNGDYDELVGLVVITSSDWMVIKIGEGRFFGEVVAKKTESIIHKNLLKKIAGVEVGKLAGYAVIVRGGKIIRKAWLPTMLRKKYF